MPYSVGGLLSPRSLVFALLCMLYLPAAFPAGSGMLELWFEYDGHPVKLASDPDVHCFRQPGMVPVSCSLYRSDDGRYWVTRPEPGRYLMRLSVDENKTNPPLQPGDLYRDYPFRIERSTTGPLLISLHRLLALHQPQDNRAALPDQAGGCDNKPTYSAAILALFPSAEVDFAWQPLGADARYRYTLWRVRCSDDMRLEQVFYRQTARSGVSEAIPPNESGQYYQLELNAVSDNQTIGELMLHDGKGGRVGEYRFIVRDPLIDRSWLYYLMGMLLLLFIGWVVVGALRSRPVTPVEKPERKQRPRGLRPALLLGLLLALGASGYLQREQLLPWLEQRVPELQQLAYNGWDWVRDKSGASSAVAAEPSRLNVAQPRQPVRQRAEWRGVIVSASATPFIGQSRRAEIRLRITGDTAEVAFLESGKWVAATGSAFRRQPSGEGMTLFGHRRGAGYSELWSISIPDTSDAEWSLAMDRMITRRGPAGGVLSFERKRASGELHASAR